MLLWWLLLPWIPVCGALSSIRNGDGGKKKTQVTTCEATVAPVSDLLRKNGTLPSEAGSSLCAPRCARCGSGASAALGGKIGGSKVKREKGTVLWHRSSSQRRAVPAALFGAFQDKESCFRTIQEKTDRCRFWGLGAW